MWFYIITGLVVLGIIMIWVLSRKSLAGSSSSLSSIPSLKEGVETPETEEKNDDYNHTTNAAGMGISGQEYAPSREESRIEAGKGYYQCPNHGPGKMCMDCAGMYEHPIGCQCYYCVPYR